MPQEKEDSLNTQLRELTREVEALKKKNDELFQRMNAMAPWECLGGVTSWPAMWFGITNASIFWEPFWGAKRISFGLDTKVC